MKVLDEYSNYISIVTEYDEVAYTTPTKTSLHKSCIDYIRNVFNSDKVSSDKSHTKYKIVTLKNKETNEIIYTYNTYNVYNKHNVCEINRPLEKFIEINGDIWWFGDKSYTLRIFVNMKTRQVFEPYGSNMKNSTNEFIWLNVQKITEYIIAVDGFIRTYPYATILIDLSKLNTGNIYPVNIVKKDDNNKLNIMNLYVEEENSFNVKFSYEDDINTIIIYDSDDNTKIRSKYVFNDKIHQHAKLLSTEINMRHKLF